MSDGAFAEPISAALQAQLAAVTEERDEYRKLVLHLREENERLKRGLLGQKAERLPANDAQLSLMMIGLALHGEPATEPVAPPPAEENVAAHTRRKPVRKPLPADLPRVQVEIVPPEVEREPDAFELIGTDVRAVLERRPASTVVLEILYKKFVRKERIRGVETEVFVADALELPIERGIAGPGMLADSIVRRWQDHQPLTRLEGIYARDGLELSKSTICTWHEQLAELVQPLVDAMFAEAMHEPVLCTDATGVLVLAKERCRTGHFWVLVAPDKHVLYRYSKRHDSAAVDELLPGYSGYLVADAHVVYDHLYKTGAVVEVGCWAHYLESGVIWSALAGLQNGADVAPLGEGELQIKRGVTRKTGTPKAWRLAASGSPSDDRVLLAPRRTGGLPASSGDW